MTKGIFKIYIIFKCGITFIYKTIITVYSCECYVRYLIINSIWKLDLNMCELISDGTREFGIPSPSQ